MQYTNPEIPEGINTTDEHPLKEFAILLGGLILTVIIIVALLSYSAAYLSRYIPFETEMELAGGYAEQMERYPEQEFYLQGLADRLVVVMDLPKGMEITVHYDDTDIMNAYATLGGHVVMYRGLLQKLPNENAVAMVLAHEIAHIKHRDPVASMGRGIAITLVLSAVGGLSGGDILGKAGLYTALKFNRDMESAADVEALSALQRLYGHVGGADTLFEAFSDELKRLDKTRLPQFFQTHPLEENRISLIREYEQQYPQARLSLIDLPAEFVESIRGQPADTEE